MDHPHSRPYTQQAGGPFLASAAFQRHDSNPLHRGERGLIVLPRLYPVVQILPDPFQLFEGVEGHFHDLLEVVPHLGQRQGDGDMAPVLGHMFCPEHTVNEVDALPVTKGLGEVGKGLRGHGSLPIKAPPFRGKSWLRRAMKNPSQ